MAVVVRALALAAGLSFMGCRGEAVEARRSEAGRLAEAVRLLRGAPSEERRPLLEALASAPCAEPDLCALRKTCADAYALELSARDALGAVRHAAQGAEPVQREAVELLTRSEEDLRRAAELARVCADREGEARRRYSL